MGKAPPLRRGTGPHLGHGLGGGVAADGAGAFCLSVQLAVRHLDHPVHHLWGEGGGRHGRDRRLRGPAWRRTGPRPPLRRAAAAGVTWVPPFSVRKTYLMLGSGKVAADWMLAMATLVGSSPVATAPWGQHRGRHDGEGDRGRGWGLKWEGIGV